jgi:predicted DsbA family dithiol-disulfide isomerase
MIPRPTSSAGSPGAGHAEAAPRLDIVSDTICPWCYVGKRRLAAALPLLAAEGLAFEVTWRPFQLNPTMPKAGLDRRDYRVAKFGSWERGRALDAQVAAAGAADGLVFRHDLMARTPNTLASHALIRLAHEVGGAASQDEVVEGLFAAYFTLGRDVGDHGVLADVGEAAGIDRARVSGFLDDPASTEAVIRDEELARGLGLSGVPSFIVDGRFLFSGAQPTASIVRALREASAALASPAKVTPAFA